MADLIELGYSETHEKLKVRIRAHTEYANFKLQDWLLNWLGNAKGCRLLDIGCGDGSYFLIYEKALGSDGLIIGLDINQDLLTKAREIGIQLRTPTIVLPWDFDNHPYPLLDKEVDLCVALFSAYYAKDVPAWVEDSLRVVKKGGRMLLVGPTEDNARELYELNEIITGIKSVAETDYTTAQLKGAFLPELQRRLGDRVRERTLDSQIIFPSPEEFAKYYFATWLYEITQKKVGKAIQFEAVVKAIKKTSMRLSKRMISIEAQL